MRYVDERLSELGVKPKRRALELIGTPIERTYRTKYSPGTTEKPCAHCGVVKTLDAYMPLKRGALGLHSVCNECRRLISKAYTRANREKKAGRLRPDVCDCCGRQPQRRALHWDHNHLTDTFRGWLCHHCNIALGTVDDSVEQLERLIAYLRRGGGPERQA